jgi:DNA polymerase III subunit beta
MLTLSKAQLQFALASVMGAVERNQTVPILQCVRIQASSAGITFTANNTQMELRARIDLAAAPFDVCVQARKLADIVSNLLDTEDITLDVDPDNAKVRIRSGRSRFALASLPADTFPGFETVQDARTFRLDPAALKRLLRKVAPCMAAKDVRYYLNGARLMIEGSTLTVTSSDGHRLATASTHIDNDQSERIECILPRDAVSTLLRLLPDAPSDQAMSMRLSYSTVTMGMTALDFATKTIEGKYPDIERAIPKTYDTELVIDREPLQAAIRRASALANENLAVGIEIENAEMRLYAANAEAESSEDYLPVDCPGSVAVGFNNRYLLDALEQMNTMQTRISLNATGGSRITETGDPGYFYIVMNLRI